MVVMAAADEAELVHMVATAVKPQRWPNRFSLSSVGNGVGCDLPSIGKPLEIGKGTNVVANGNTSSVAFLWNETFLKF